MQSYYPSGGGKQQQKQQGASNGSGSNAQLTAVLKGENMETDRGAGSEQQRDTTASRFVYVVLLTADADAMMMINDDVRCDA